MTSQLEALADRILKLFQSKKHTAGALPPEPGEGGKRPPGTLKSEKAFEERLGRFLSEKNLVSAGRVQIIGLDQLRGHFGERWESVTANVHGIMRGIIETHLTAADLYTQKGDIGYVLVFGNLTTEEAEIKAMLIAEEIHNHLIGDDSMTNVVEVKTAVVGVDKSVTVHDAGLLDAVTRILERSISSGAGSGAAQAAPTPGRGHTWLQELFFLYRLIWDVRRKVLSTYLCTAARKIPSGGVAKGSELIAVGDALSRIAELDIFVLDRVRRDLQSLHRNKRRVLMACPVHVPTLGDSKSRFAYRDMCQSLPDTLRRDLVFELIGLSEDFPQSRVLDLVSGLKALSRSVTARVRLDHKKFDTLRGAGVDAVGVDLGRSGAAEGKIMERMDRFVELASGAGLRTFAYGLNTLSLATVANSSGFDYIEGDAVHAEVDEPDHIYRFQSEDLFAHLLAPKS